ncbi:MAG: hypothetical protein FH749_15940 [Firmicutes bacterium]|nr:hypothetical protein [Bacillota bacterium]
MTDQLLEAMLTACCTYLHDNTREVYRPVLVHLEQHHTLQEFRLKTRPHGFGINYEWLCRVGLVERYPEPVRINNQIQCFQIGYRVSNQGGGE